MSLATVDVTRNEIGGIGTVESRGSEVVKLKPEWESGLMEPELELLN